MLKRIFIILMTLTGCAQPDYPFYETNGAKLKIRTYENDMNDKSKVEALSFEAMNLGELPSDFAEFKNLRYLNLRRNKLKSIPTSVTDLSNLSVLFVDHNPITALPDRIVNLKNLKVLTINKTLIDNLPDGFHDLKLKLFLIGGAKLNDTQRWEVMEKMKETKIINSVD